MGDATSPHIKFWAEEFTKLGHEVHVISPYDVKIEGVKVYSTKTKYHKSINFLISYVFIRDLIKKIKPDVVHAHYLGTFSFLGALTGFHPFVGTVWGSDIDIFGRKNALSNLMLKYTLKKADMIEAPDETTKEFLIKRYRIEDKKIDVPYWGVNTKKFSPIKSKKDTDIAYLRKSSPKYFTSDYIEALNIVKKRFPKIISTLIMDKNYIKVEKMIGEYKLENNIKNMSWVPHEETPALLNSSLIYVDSFNRKVPGGGMGITAMEAMSCGLPVILADNPGVSDYIKDGYNGLIYKGGDYNELAQCIIKLMENKELREKIGKNARKTILSELDWDKISKKIERKYYELFDKYNS